MNDQSDWEALIQKHLDGRTTTEEAETLSTRIVADAEVRSLYLKAAQVHGALADETLALDLEAEPEPAVVSPEPRRVTWQFAWPRQIAAGLVAGLFVGVLGVGMVWAVASPKAEARVFSIAHGDFESMAVGTIPNRIPAKFGEWGGDPAEVIEEVDGNQVLRFLETANVTGDPNGGASACNVFQIIDLSTLRQQSDTENSGAQITLKLSARFRREAAPADAELPKLGGGLTIHLYQAEPESIGKAWPHVIRDAVALGNKAIKLDPGEESATISASCILSPEATIALISVNANTRMPTKTPITLGGYYVDDVQLTVIKQPNIPVQFVK